MTGLFELVNLGDYFAIRKGRTATDGNTHWITVGVGADGACVLEHYTGTDENFENATVDGRLQMYPFKTGTYALALRKNSSSNELFPIYGAHNKPSGSYIGNGDATVRTIEIGGIGGLLHIVGGDASTLVSANGALTFYANETTIIKLAASEMNFANGILTIASTNARVNYNGTTYTCSLL